jgi:hypothetical protein
VVVNDGSGDVIRDVPAEVEEDPADGRLVINVQVVAVDPESIGIAVGSTPGLQLKGPTVDTPGVQGGSDHRSR